MADNTQPAVSTGNALARRDGSAVALMPNNLEDAYKIAQRLAKSGLVPSSMRDNPDAVFAGMLLASEIGVSTMQGLSNIAVVNGRASVWGELATAIVRASGLCEYLNPPKYTGTGASLKCSITGKRKGEKDEVTMEYSMADAELAGHTSKDTYRKNPKDMIMWKAMHRLFKFLWPDVLKGLSLREFAGEEVLDVVAEEVKLGAAAAIPAALPVEIPGDQSKTSTSIPEDELRAKTEAAKLKKLELEKLEADKEKAKLAEAKKVPAAEPEAEMPGAPADVLPGDAAGPEAGAKLPDGEVRHIGTIAKCPYKANADKSGYDYFVVIATADGEVRLQCPTKEVATALNALKGKTMTVIANAKKEVVRYQ